MAVCHICCTEYNGEDFLPKMLPCDHTFCSPCLQIQIKGSTGLVTCPLCKGETTITDVSELSTALNILALKSQADQQEGQSSKEAQAMNLQEPSLSARCKVNVETTGTTSKPSFAKSNIDQDASLVDVEKRLTDILNEAGTKHVKKMIKRVNDIPIDTIEKVSVFVNLLYESAMGTQIFSGVYAHICHEFFGMTDRGEGCKSGKALVEFKGLMLKKCHMEFEKYDMEERKTIARRAIEKCDDPEEKQELELKLDNEVDEARHRALGNVRFIGELYRRGCLLSSVVLTVIDTLLKRRDEVSLECLCILLTIIGRILEIQCREKPETKQELDKHFAEIEMIMNDHQTSALVRFLIRGVMNLRQKAWITRSENFKFKTLEAKRGLKQHAGAHAHSEEINDKRDSIVMDDKVGSTREVPSSVCENKPVPRGGQPRSSLDLTKPILVQKQGTSQFLNKHEFLKEFLDIGLAVAEKFTRAIFFFLEVLPEQTWSVVYILTNFYFDIVLKHLDRG